MPSRAEVAREAAPLLLPMVMARRARLAAEKERQAATQADTEPVAS